jgi:hypothetical protein
VSSILATSEIELEDKNAWKGAEIHCILVPSKAAQHVLGFIVLVKPCLACGLSSL